MKKIEGCQPLRNNTFGHSALGRRCSPFVDPNRNSQLKAFLLTAVVVLLALAGFWWFLSHPANSRVNQVAQKTSTPDAGPSALPAELSAPETTGAAAPHHAALAERVEELRQRRADLSKKLASIEERLIKKGNAAGPTDLEQAKVALQETLRKEESEEKYLQNSIDNQDPASAATQ